MSYNDIFSDIQENNMNDIQSYISDSSIDLDIVNPYDLNEAIDDLISYNDEPDSSHHHKRCVRCYIKVVKKYIHKVIEYEKQFCSHAKCPYIQHLCKYLEEHHEYNVGLIAGMFKPFKFAAGYCIGNESCERHHDSDLIAVSSVLKSFK